MEKFEKYLTLSQVVPEKRVKKGGFYIDIFDCFKGRFVSYVNNFENSLKI